MDAEKRPFCPLTASARPKLIVLDGPFCTLFYAQLTIELNHDRLPVRLDARFALYVGSAPLDHQALFRSLSHRPERPGRLLSGIVLEQQILGKFRIAHALG